MAHDLQNTQGKLKLFCWPVLLWQAFTVTPHNAHFSLKVLKWKCLFDFPQKQCINILLSASAFVWHVSVNQNYCSIPGKLQTNKETQILRWLTGVGRCYKSRRMKVTCSSVHPCIQGFWREVSTEASHEHEHSECTHQATALDARELIVARIADRFWSGFRGTSGDVILAAVSFAQKWRLLQNDDIVLLSFVNCQWNMGNKPFSIVYYTTLIHCLQTVCTKQSGYRVLLLSWCSQSKLILCGLFMLTLMELCCVAFSTQTL